MLEYFNLDARRPQGSGRHGALKTANSGYLTRRLVDVAQDCIVARGGLRHRGRSITLTASIAGGEVTEDLGERILGRTLADDIR